MLELYKVLVQVLVTTSKTKLDIRYYKLVFLIVPPVAKRLKIFPINQLNICDSNQKTRERKIFFSRVI